MLCIIIAIDAHCTCIQSYILVLSFIYKFYHTCTAYIIPNATNTSTAVYTFSYCWYIIIAFITNQNWHIYEVCLSNNFIYNSKCEINLTRY